MRLPKYSIGDTVFAARVETTGAVETCPDCLGSRTWTAHLPNGEEFPIKCQTCTFGYETRGTIPAVGCTASVETLTIGSVRFDTNEPDRKQVSYMCEETGVGSGRIHYEQDLFATREEVESLLPELVATREREMSETRALSCMRRRNDSPGRMAAAYRAQIRKAKKDIEQAERGLEREAAGAR